MESLKDIVANRKARKAADKAKAKKVFGHSDFWLDDSFFKDKKARSSVLLSKEDEDEVYSGVGSDSIAERASNFEKIQRLSAVRRAISNFVSIVAGENLPVMFNGGKQSYTDGKVVVIAADDNPRNFDVMVGLACHEAAHVLLSDFEHLKTVGNVRKHLAVRVRYSDDLNNLVMRDGYSVSTVEWNNKAATNVVERLLHPFIVDKLNKEFPAARPKPSGVPIPDADKIQNAARINKILEIFDDLKTIENIIEDRRIDYFVYNSAAGYRPYYDAMYAKYFYTKEISKNLKFNPAWRELTVDNYINRLLYFFHPDNDQDAMPGLRQLVNHVDIPNLHRIAPDKNDSWKNNPDFQVQPALWKLANEVYAFILRFVDLASARSEFEGEDAPEGGHGESSSIGLPNLDGGIPSMEEMVPSEVEDGNAKLDDNKLAKALKDAHDHMEGELKKRKVSKKDAQAIEAFEKAEGKTVELKGYGLPNGIKVLVTRKVTKETLDQDWFIFGSTRRWMIDTTGLDRVAVGRRMGQILHHKLQIRNDPLVTHQTRLTNGKIDKRLLAQLGMENLSVFKKTRIDLHKPAMLHLSLDASGSMGGKKWDKAMAVAVALAYVGSKLRNVDTVISIRGGDMNPVVAVVFDSRRDNFATWAREIAPNLNPAGATPESLCYQATMDIITESADTHDVYFINFSDGEPVMGLKVERDYWTYSGELAHKHCRAMVNLMKEKNINVLSYFISETYEGTYSGKYNSSSYIAKIKKVFTTMYGETASFVDVAQVPSVLATLNSFLRERA